MKHLIYTLALSTSLTLSTTAETEDLKASHIAAAQGMQWWSISIPDTSSENLKIFFEIVHADGKTQRTGSMSFKPNNKLKAFCWPNAKGELEVSIVFDGVQGAMRTRFHEHPFSKARLTTTPSMIGSTVTPGLFLTKGTTGDSVSSDQTLEKNSFGLRVVVEPQN